MSGPLLQRKKPIVDECLIGNHQPLSEKTVRRKIMAGCDQLSMPQIATAAGVFEDNAYQGKILARVIH